MSGDGKRGDGHRPPATAPIFDSTLLSASTVIGIIPILLVGFMIVEFHALNDVIAEPDADIGVGLKHCSASKRRCRAYRRAERSETGAEDPFHPGFALGSMTR